MNNVKVLPQGWVWTNLGTVFENFQYGYTTTSVEEKKGPKLLRITDLKEEGVDWEDVPYCIIDEKKLSKFLLHDGDFVFARSGSTEKNWCVEMPPMAVFASYLIRSRPIDSTYNDWFEKFFKSDNYIEQVKNKSAGIAQQNINAKKLAEIRVPLAPLQEKLRIINKLNSLKSHSITAFRFSECENTVVGKA